MNPVKLHPPTMKINLTMEDKPAVQHTANIGIEGLEV
jgi:hypothetical protein